MNRRTNELAEENCSEKLTTYSLFETQLATEKMAALLNSWPQRAHAHPAFGAIWIVTPTQASTAVPATAYSVYRYTSIHVPGAVKGKVRFLKLYNYRGWPKYQFEPSSINLKIEFYLAYFFGIYVNP